MLRSHPCLRVPAACLRLPAPARGLPAFARGLPAPLSAAHSKRTPPSPGFDRSGRNPWAKATHQLVPSCKPGNGPAFPYHRRRCRAFADGQPRRLIPVLPIGNLVGQRTLPTRAEGTCPRPRLPYFLLLLGLLSEDFDSLLLLSLLLPLSPESLFFADAGEEPPLA